MEKKYILELDGRNIGYTKFEFADTPMGVIHGKIIFNQINSPYEFFKDHCIKFNVQINSDLPKDRFIDTAIIPQLRIFLEREISCKVGVEPSQVWILMILKSNLLVLLLN